jgi:hypothetical protein
MEVEERKKNFLPPNPLTNVKCNGIMFVRDKERRFAP